MKLTCMSCAFALGLLFAVAAKAQLPVDNPVYKTRCELLASRVSPANVAKPPQQFVAVTHGVPGLNFYTLGVNRAQATDHYVACTVYYLAAVATANGNGSKPDAKLARNYAILAGAELKLASKQRLTMEEHLKRGEMKVENVKGLSLSSDQTTAVIDAVSTMPLH